MVMPEDLNNIESREDDLEVEGSDEGDLEVQNAVPSISLAKNDRSLSDLYRWFKDSRLVIDPEWQRQYVWDRKRASRLIESFLIDLPIPVIYLAVNDQGKYEVIDGLQRLTSAFDYFDNKYPLTGLEIQRGLNGKKFGDLTPLQQYKLWDTTLRTFELAQNTPKDLMFLIFERLNTGGVALNDMEIRNCLFRGKLNDLLKELAEDENFVAAVSQKGLQKRMKDRMLVLRFLAFYERNYKIARKGLKAFFNDYLDDNRNPKESKIKQLRKVFKQSMKASHTIFGDKGFRLRRGSIAGGGEWTPNINASIFQVIAVSFTEYDAGALTRSADCIFEAYLDLLATDQKWVECVQHSTGDYQRIEYSFETWRDRLKLILASVAPNDNRRLFSRSLKEEMFQQDATCKLCGSKIVLLNDAALDHHHQYWLGGQTVPENARLVHRLCNQKRPRQDD
jgi:hypothetical protein